MLLTVACSQGSAPIAADTPIALASPSANASSAASPPPVPVAASYGLLLAGGKLEMITPDGLVGPSASIAPPTLQTCIPGLNANLEPPVSATADKVFYRDGDTNIRYLTPAGKTGDATTVPGSATSVSFFAVSPDDQRIAVLVEDFSAATTIGLQLYVEDMNGGGHHAVIYATTTSRNASATTLWPMGGHHGNLVLAQMTGCTNDPGSYAPSEWHVADASNGNRIATIKRIGPAGVIPNFCNLSYWPSAAGVACFVNQEATVFDWTGKLVATVVIQGGVGYGVTQSGLSPSGRDIFFSSQGLCSGAAAPGTVTVCPVFGTIISSQGGNSYASVDATNACLWIDETHLLAPDSVMVASQTAGGPVTETRRWLPASGVCAGRYPGGL
jgi:hypothetical protein